MGIFEKKVYGTTADNEEVAQFILKNKNGMELRVIEYGGIITHLFTPDKNGNLDDVVLGHDSLAEYEDSSFYLGALIGRYGNRIADGKFKLDGTEYILEQNNETNCLHGGSNGFHNRIWKGEQLETNSGVGLLLKYHSPENEGNFPGAVDVEVSYFLTEDNALEIEYKATPTAKTVLNLTQHTYFNLSGLKEDILGHELTINAQQFVPVDSLSIPLDSFADVVDTPFDFTTPKLIGKDINADHEQIKMGNGYDHTFIVQPDGNKLMNIATVTHAESGRIMEVLTTEPGVQFYSGNFLENTPKGKGSTANSYRSGLCLETQHYPDSPNRPDFPSTVVEAGEEYFTKTVYRFGAI